MRLILASASPRRADLLAAAGFSFDVRPVEVDETVQAGEDPERYVLRLAVEKARACDCRDRDDIVLAADTAVLADECILGKPAGDADARRMLESLSGREHAVLTGVAVRRGDRLLTAVEVSRVRFLPLTGAEIEWYLASGEPADKAGAYAVQGLASRFVDRIDGSYANVVGLPVARVYQLLQALVEPDGSEAPGLDRRSLLLIDPPGVRGYSERTAPRTQP